MKIWIPLLCLLLVSCGRGYSDGARTGTLNKLSYKGFTMKSWEGELNLGGIKSTDTGGVAANVWAFSVVDAAVAQRAEKLLGRRVVVHYTQWVINPPSVDTDYEATSVAEEHDSGHD